MNRIRQTSQALRLTAADDPAAQSVVLGMLYLSGALLVLLSLLLPHPGGASKPGLWGICALATFVGAALVVWAGYTREWVLHVVLAAGTALICLCVLFAGVAAGIYSAMFIWVLLMATSFFSARAVGAHVAWILLTWGLTLASVEELSGFSAVTRWTLGSLVLIVAAWVMTMIVAARRSSEEQMRIEILERERLQSQLQHLADHDPLTGVANRRRFDQELIRELARARRQADPPSVIALDLDGFKIYNDEHGHPAGDDLLRLTAGAWTGALRAEDLLARVGGDEFLALLPACPLAEAERVAQRLCKEVPRGLACSSGITIWDGCESPADLLARADRLMYAAKRDVAATSAQLPGIA